MKIYGKLIKNSKFMKKMENMPKINIDQKL